jgi:hypothetical protein
MFLSSWIGRSSRSLVVEDPEQLGYRLVSDPLLDVLPAEEWFALERAATDGDAQTIGQ